MNTSLVLNEKGDIALFYDFTLPFKPEWVALDVDRGEICIADENAALHRIKLDRIQRAIYTEISRKTKIMLVRTTPGPDKKPVEALWVTLSTAIETP